MRRHGHTSSSLHPTAVDPRRHQILPTTALGAPRPKPKSANTLSSRKVLITCGSLSLWIWAGVHAYRFLGPSPTSDADPSAIQNDLPSRDGGEPLRRRQLRPLRKIDREQYTVRINTWKRPEQLLTSVEHLSLCTGAAQIQIVWCDLDEDPPTELADYDKVVVERHSANTLNERFNVIAATTPTLGILSIDDDVLRPCEAIDAGFFKWTRNPDRMVGFDGRLHVENPDGTWEVRGDGRNGWKECRYGLRIRPSSCVA